MKTLTKCSSVILFSVCVATLSLSPQAYAGKKGVAGNIQNAAKVSATWGYDWGCGMPSMPSGVEYVPMWWSYYGANQAADTAAAVYYKSKGATSLLTYNEPNSSSQANLTTAYALQGFKQAGVACNAAGLACISPACTDDNVTWMVQFMAAVASSGTKCDAVAVHTYVRGGSSFLSYVDGIHNRYGKNLWITEFAPTDWASPTAVTTAEVVTFIKTAIPGLESRSYVVRYSWYCGTLPGPNVLGTAALFDSSGNVTECGKVYQNPSYTPGGGGGGAIANGTYKVINRNSGKCMEVGGNQTGNGANVQQWGYVGSASQKWTVSNQGGSQYNFIGVGSGRALDVYGNSTADGANVDIWDWWGGNQEKWTITATSGGYYNAINVSTGKALEVGGNSTADGGNVQQWGYVGSNSQQWAFQAP